MALTDDLERIAAVVAAHGEVAGVLAAEPSAGGRVYLVAFGQEDALEWLVVDDQAEPVTGRTAVRDVASIVVMCELAGELAAGGDLDELRAKLAQVRLIEQPEGIEEAEAAALALERAVGSPPRVASPAYLDGIGAATRELERALGEVESPFASAITSSAGAVESFVREVETRYKLPLG
ncbi:MAG TPA: hypothetical protein VG652_12595 [Gaiellaceae bacterium]|nr:hypothetical protein [Gaiellaceae bacterium]